MIRTLSIRVEVDVDLGDADELSERLRREIVAAARDGVESHENTHRIIFASSVLRRR